MRSVYEERVAEAIKVPVESGSELSNGARCGTNSKSTVGCDSDGADWFSSMARGLLGKDAGLHLHYVTGFPESSCYKYTARHEYRQPPAYLLRAILRSEQGAVWLAALMENSGAQWWLDHIRAQRISEQVSKLDLR